MLHFVFWVYAGLCLAAAGRVGWRGVQRGLQGRTTPSISLAPAPQRLGNRPHDACGRHSGTAKWTGWRGGGQDDRQLTRQGGSLRRASLCSPLSVGTSSPSAPLSPTTAEAGLSTAKERGRRPTGRKDDSPWEGTSIWLCTPRGRAPSANSPFPTPPLARVSSTNCVCTNGTRPRRVSLSFSHGQRPPATTNRMGVTLSQAHLAQAQAQAWRHHAHIRTPTPTHTPLLPIPPPRRPLRPGRWAWQSDNSNGSNNMTLEYKNDLVDKERPANAARPRPANRCRQRRGGQHPVITHSSG